MNEGNFYFVKDKFINDVGDPNLMKNKEVINGVKHNRPAYYAFELDGLFWLIPISSKVNKYHRVQQQKIAKHGRCDTIEFAEVLGVEKAFLIQNMFPITSVYINNEYLHNGIPVQIDGVSKQRIIRKAKKCLALQKQGKKIIFPDIDAIYNFLQNK